MTETLTYAPGRGPASGLDEIASELLANDKFVVVSHLNPDGDAIGSSSALEQLLLQLGKDVIVYIPGAVVPPEFEFVRSPTLTDDIPDDIAERVLVAVDCGNESRVKNDALLASAKRVLNIDHHGDNTHFGQLNHVRAEAACAAQLVWELAGHLGISEPGLAVALPVYIGLVTDTGRFQYSNTTAESFQLAAELARTGVDVHDVYSRIFENVTYPRLRLLGRALENSLQSRDGRVVATHLTQGDFDHFGATEDDAEGVVDALRSVEGTYVAVFLRDLPPGGEHEKKGSLRTTRDDIDVSAVARSWNGGGHRQAAGFNTSDDLAAVVDRVDDAIRE
ncbi:MAG: phosphoesterase RecJ domain protein, partial [Thermoleophilia bacterium]|nr:phosphoesterase RecJ domain protein [Thermoleophilia bacterium]